MEINETEVLVHHGILGQKWGIRRYRNKDGTLTPAGKKRAAKLEAERKFLYGDKPKTESTTKKAESSSKSVKDMSDDELRTATNRLNLEKQYKEAYSNANNQALGNAVDKLQLEKNYKDLYNNLHPVEKSAATKYMEKLKDSAVNSLSDAISKNGKVYIEKLLNNAMGIKEEPSKEAAYRKEAEELAKKGTLSDQTKYYKSIYQYVTAKSQAKGDGKKK